VAEAGAEIDEDRARAALERAERILAENPPPQQVPEIMASLRRSTLRLKVARRHAGRRSTCWLELRRAASNLRAQLQR
jgi:hypothetical protein